MTLKELKDLVEGGEDSKLEFKESLPHPEAIASEIVAFANVEGGLILFGVRDNGDVCGISDAKAEEQLVNICRQNVDPPIIPVIEKIKTDNKVVLALHVPKGYAVVSTQNGKYYVRVGSTKRQPSKEELARLFQKSRQVQFDETLIEAAQVSDIDLAKVDVLLKSLKQPTSGESKLPVENLLLNLRILQKVERGVYPSVAGLLAFGKNAHHYLPGATIQAANYHGASRTAEVMDQKEIQGTADEQIEGAVRFVKSNMRLGSIIKATKRIEFPDYAVEAVREAITNAVAHRNYSITGSSIRLFMYEDRLEILSPGGLPNTVTLENMKIVQFARNQLLVSYLAGLGYMERRGEGILRMIDWSLQNNAPEPQFALPAENIFQVTLFKRTTRDTC